MDRIMKIKKSVVIIVAALVVVVAAAVVLLHTAGYIPGFGAYDPAAPTAKKLAKIESYLPENADLVIVADIYRLSTMPTLKSFLEEGLFKGEDTAIKTIRSLLGPETKIGMIAMSAVLGDSSSPISFLVVVQGDFRETHFVEEIKKELAAENAALASQTVGGVSLYSQEGENSPFAFAVPDRNHLVVGTKESMEHVFLQKPANGKTFPFESTESPFFGYLKSCERIRKILPPQFASLAMANFWADERKVLHISVECADAEQAGSLKMFLLGMKALYMLQGESNKALVDALGNIAIGGDENVVRIDAPLEDLPAIFPAKN
jgi:hypothetical protein